MDNCEIHPTFLQGM